MQHDTCTITKTVHSAIPKVPFCRIKDAVAGKRYALSLVFAGDKRTRALNQKYRHKQYIPNVLSFPLSKNEGELFINLNRARVEARAAGLSYSGYVAFLFIHGLLHLKGMRHSATMEKRERALLRQFQIR